MSLEGKVWRYGDNIDTDVIIPARYLNSFDPKELASHCMVDIDESFADNVREGDIMGIAPTCWPSPSSCCPWHAWSSYPLPTSASWSHC